MTITAFMGVGGDLANVYSVGTRGDERDAREVWNWASQASRSKQLSPDELARLKVAIGQLPSTNSYPPISRLVLVGHLEDGKWVSHSYDSQSLPPAMSGIYELLGGER